MTPEAIKTTLQQVAAQCVARADGCNLTDKKRDNMAADYYAGVCAAFVAAYGETAPITQRALQHFALIVAPRGFAGVQSLAKEKP